MMMTACLAMIDITCFDIILSVANDLEPSWMETSNVDLWQQPRDLHFQALLVDFAVT